MSESGKKWRPLDDAARGDDRPFEFEEREIGSVSALVRLGRRLQRDFPREIVGCALSGGASLRGAAISFTPYEFRLIADADGLDPFLSALIREPETAIAPDFFETSFYRLADKTAFRLAGQFHHDPGAAPPASLRRVRALSGAIDWSAVNAHLSGLDWKRPGIADLPRKDGETLNDALILSARAALGKPPR